MEKIIYSINQNNRPVLKGDKTSIMMIFNNLTGNNSQVGDRI